MEIILPIVVGLVSAAIGLAVGKSIFGKVSTTAVKDAEAEAKRIKESAEREAGKTVLDAQKDANKVLKDAEHDSKRILATANKETEQLKKDKLLEVKENYLTKKSEIERLEKERDQRLIERERKLDKQSQSLKDKLKDNEKKSEELDKLKLNLKNQLELLNEKQSVLDAERSEQIKKLEQIGQLSSEEAKIQLIDTMKAEARTQAMSHVKEIMDEAKANANKEAKKIVLQTIQRTAAEQAIENTVSVYNLDSDDQKGQIIGREGRNIRALESATGVEFIVDDTP